MSVIANIKITEGGWNVGNYSFKRLGEKEKARYTYSCANATLRKKVTVRKSILYEGGTELDDILLLYNFFLRGNACHEDSLDLYMRKISPGPSIQKDFSECISAALSTLRKRGWRSANKDKLLAFNWMLRARVREELQIAFFNKWVVFELLEKYIHEIDSVLKTIGVQKFRVFRKFWRDVRNEIVHSGKCDYSHFVANGLLGVFSKGKKRFTEDERRYFRKYIRRRNFLQFHADSEAIMDIVLTFYFASLLGIANLRKWYHVCFFERLRQYDAKLEYSLSIKNKKNFEVKFES